MNENFWNVAENAENTRDRRGCDDEDDNRIYDTIGGLDQHPGSDDHRGG